jgi:hypothetical protein
MKRIALFVPEYHRPKTIIPRPEPPNCIEIHMSLAVASVVADMLGLATSGAVRYTPELLRTRLTNSVYAYTLRMIAVGLKKSHFEDLIITLRHMLDYAVKIGALVVFETIPEDKD